MQSSKFPGTVWAQTSWPRIKEADGVMCGRMAVGMLELGEDGCFVLQIYQTRHIASPKFSSGVDAPLVRHRRALLIRAITASMEREGPTYGRQCRTQLGWPIACPDRGYVPPSQRGSY